MLVYRVEHEENGFGPYYQTGIPPYLDALLSKHSRRNPIPCTDKSLSSQWRMMGRTDAYFFGFISLEQLSEWFRNDDERVALREAGFVICVYDTNDFCLGDHQLVFRRVNSTRVETLVITRRLPAPLRFKTDIDWELVLSPSSPPVIAWKSIFVDYVSPVKKPAYTPGEVVGIWATSLGTLSLIDGAVTEKKLLQYKMLKDRDVLMDSKITFSDTAIDWLASQT